MKWAAGILAVLAGGVAVAVAVGALLPEKHAASRTVRLNQAPEVLWDALTDYRAAPSWRPDVTGVERLPDKNGHPVWRESYHGGDRISYEIVEAARPGRLVRRIADEGLPFGGTWTIEITGSAAGSAVTVTEHGAVYNPVYRFVSKFVIGHTATIDAYLEALGQKFDERVVITDGASPPAGRPVAAPS